MYLKKSTRSLLTLALAFVLAFSLASCGSADKTDEEVPTEESTGSAGESVTEEPEAESAETDTRLACPSINGKLSVNGTQLCDQDGTPVQLRGISTHGLAWYPDYINQDCVNELKSWGANLLRLAMYTAESGGYCTDGDQEELKNLIRKGVEYAANADMYVIVDWHILSEGTPAAYQSEAAAFFDEMSKEFADQDNVLYEICNEPNTADWPAIKAYAEDIIPVIRANDPDAVIIVGTPTWSQDVDQAAADPITGQKNIMYTLHFYAATHKDDLRSKMARALADGLPIFVTEFGICDASGNGALDIDSANEWIRQLDESGISYAVWNLSNKDESSSIINTDVSKTSGFTYEDLSESGKWVYDLLQRELNDTSIEDAAAAVTEEVEETQAGTVTDDGLTVHMDLDSSWDDGAGTCSYLYRGSVDNTTGEAINDWRITLQFNEDITLSDGWNGICTADGNTLTITNEDYNGSLGIDESASDIGFIIEGSSDLKLEIGDTSR